MKTSNIYARVFLIFALLFAANYAQAKVVLPAVFTNNMVLQQKTDVAFWGKANPGKKVEIRVSWNNKNYTASAGETGDWKVMIPTPSFGGPYQVTFSDGDGAALTLANVMIGEVWVCSGQSNMEMPLAGWGKIDNYEKEIADAKYPDIRLFQVGRAASNFPLEDVTNVANGGWTPCSAQSVGEFSAVAYFFARELHKETGIPIGLIHTSWGGTVAEAWTSAETLNTLVDFADAVKKVSGTQAAATPVTAATPVVEADPNRATVLYNAMINPFIQFTIRGAIWYQGESNAERASQYRKLFPAMITDWRTKWKQGDFPFYFVQLANFMKTEEAPVASAWAELRDAQRQTLSLSNTGMAVTIDIGDAEDIHPKNKQDVGKRLALIALAKNYGKKITYSGPAFTSQKVEGNTIRLNFDFTNDGLNAKGGELKGFAIAGADQKFYWAKAIVKGKQIVVSSPEVANPIAVRYGWANNPQANLYNGAGLPASPFKTDNWQDTTIGKK